jgi:prolyl-tRNA editing enzyme YbaK/EbsC (Cys-tRNA(Pro) deacylase)
MAIDKVKEYFKKFNIEDRIIELPESSATVALAAKALGTEECRIAKSLSFLINDKAILIITAGDAKIDNAKYKGFFNIKAKMIPFNEVEDYIGHAAGGVCPFAIKEGIDVYLDESLKRFDYVYPACGSGNSAIKLTIPELEKYSNYKEWIDVTKY